MSINILILVSNRVRSRVAFAHKNLKQYAAAYHGCKHMRSAKMNQ